MPYHQVEVACHRLHRYDAALQRDLTEWISHVTMLQRNANAAGFVRAIAVHPYTITFSRRGVSAFGFAQTP
jgi:hypothetical protein